MVGQYSGLLQSGDSVRPGTDRRGEATRLFRKSALMGTEASDARIGCSGYLRYSLSSHLTA